jgi:UDP-glucose 4-epimerase
MSDNAVLISGGFGFIGSHLAVNLIVKGYAVTFSETTMVFVNDQSPQ